ALGCIKSRTRHTRLSHYAGSSLAGRHREKHGYRHRITFLKGREESDATRSRSASRRSRRTERWNFGEWSFSISSRSVSRVATSCAFVAAFSTAAAGVDVVEKRA